MKIEAMRENALPNFILRLRMMASPVTFVREAVIAKRELLTRNLVPLD